MTWRKTVAYWVAALLLGGYYWAVERAPTPAPVAETPREKLLPVFRDEIRELRLEREGRTIVAELRDRRWHLVSPAGIAVPSDLVAALIETLAERQESEVVEASAGAEQMSLFGLATPTAKLTVMLSGGKTETIELGNRNPTRTAVYARREGSPRILLAGLNVQYYGDLLFEAAFPGAERPAAEEAAGAKN